MKGFSKVLRVFELNGIVYGQRLFCCSDGSRTFVKVKPFQRGVNEWARI